MVHPGFTELADVELVAIADADEARGQRAVAAYGGQYYHDYHNVLHAPTSRR